MQPDKIVTSAFPPERMDIGLSISQQNRRAEFQGDDDAFFPLRFVQKGLVDQAMKKQFPHTELVSLDNAIQAIIWKETDQTRRLLAAIESV